MKLLILGSKDWPRVKLLVKEARKRKYKVTVASFMHLEYELLKNNKFEIKYRGKDLKEFDLAVFSGFTKPNPAPMIMLAQYFKQHKVSFLEEKYAAQAHDVDKMLMYKELRDGGCACLPIYNASNKKVFLKYLKKAEYPLMLKNRFGLRGKGIYYCEDFAKAKKIIQRYKNYFLFAQKFLCGQYYYRVTVLGYRALPYALKRRTLKCEGRNRISKEPEIVKVDKQLRQLAEQAARAVQLEVSGVDIMFDGKKPYILEVNQAPGFELFSKHTKTNVAEEILDYLLKKRKK